MSENLQLSYRSAPLEMEGFQADPTGWILVNAEPLDQPVWLLAFADDGVIWGKVENGKVLLSSQEFPDISPEFTSETLQKAYLFNADKEIRLWRQNGELTACLTEDIPGDDGFAFDESYLLWGTQVEEEKNDFSLVSDGRQGLMHAVPLAIDSSIMQPDYLYRPLRLKMRHYVGFERDNGQAVFVASRLVGLTAERR